MKIVIYSLLFAIGASSPFISSKLGFDSFSTLIIVSLLGLAAIVLKAAFRSNKWGLFGVYSNFKSVTTVSFTRQEKDAVIGLIVLFLATLASIFMRP